MNLKGRDGADRIADGNREGDDDGDGDGDAMPMLRLEDDDDGARQGFLPRAMESRDSEIGNTPPRPPLRGAAAVEVGLDGQIGFIVGEICAVGGGVGGCLRGGVARDAAKTRRLFPHRPQASYREIEGDIRDPAPGVAGGLRSEAPPGDLSARRLRANHQARSVLRPRRPTGRPDPPSTRLRTRSDLHDMFYLFTIMSETFFTLHTVTHAPLKVSQFHVIAIHSTNPVVCLLI